MDEADQRAERRRVGAPAVLQADADEPERARAGRADKPSGFGVHLGARRGARELSRHGGLRRARPRSDRYGGDPHPRLPPPRAPGFPPRPRRVPRKAPPASPPPPENYTPPPLLGPRRA